MSSFSSGTTKLCGLGIPTSYATLKAESKFFRLRGARLDVRLGRCMLRHSRVPPKRHKINIRKSTR